MRLRRQHSPSPCSCPKTASHHSQRLERRFKKLVKQALCGGMENCGTIEHTSRNSLKVGRIKARARRLVDPLKSRVPQRRCLASRCLHPHALTHEQPEDANSGPRRIPSPQLNEKLKQCCLRSQRGRRAPNQCQSGSRRCTIYARREGSGATVATPAEASNRAPPSPKGSGDSSAGRRFAAWLTAAGGP